jgi:hypothetical protein
MRVAAVLLTQEAIEAVYAKLGVSKKFEEVIDLAYTTQGS